MAFVRSTNAESGIWSVEGWGRNTTNNEVVRDNTIAPYAGSWSWCVGGDGINKLSWFPTANVASPVDIWHLVSYRLRISALPAASISSFYPLPSSGANTIGSLVLNTNGTMNPLTSVISSPGVSAPLVPGQWHLLEFAYINYGLSSAWNTLVYRLDGVEFARVHARFNVGYISRQVLTGYAAATAIRVNIDDVLVNDETGASSNYWLGRVKPVSVGKPVASVRSKSAVSEGNAVNPVVVLAPPSIVAGDLLVAVVSATSVLQFPSFPAGWSILRGPVLSTSSSPLYLLSKVATGSEPSSYAFTQAGTRIYTSICYALANVDTANPVIDFCDYFGSSLQGTLIGMPPLDLSEGDALMMEYHMNNAAGQVITAPARLHDVTNYKASGSNLALVAGFYERADGGLVAGDLMTQTATSVASRNAVIAFRSAPPATRRFLAVA
jgi:hypothetical protein